jgi:lysozyme family protein
MNFEELRESYARLWATAKFNPNWEEKAEKAARGIIADKSDYQRVEDYTGVPWYAIGLIHQMESGRNFKCHLHNGDPLTGRTTNVPAGRPRTGRPPFTWTESAVDALCQQGLDQVMSWPMERIAFELERYNGFRSRVEHGINTPYLWSGTNHYKRGKFIRDNVWSDTAISKQVGALAILRKLVQIDQSVAAALDKPCPEMPAIPAPGIDAAGVTSGERRVLDLEELQLRLSTIPLYPPEQVDGIYGPLSQAAIRAFLVQQNVPGAAEWRGEHLLIAGVQALCRLDNIDAGPIDGLLGPQTRYALDVYAGRRNNNPEPETWRDAFEDRPHPTQLPKTSKNWPRQADVPSFYGERGINQVMLKFPYAMRLAWDLDQVVHSTYCHEKIHDAALRALRRALEHYGEARIRELRLDRFGGCLNVRKMRGGSRWSMHSWGIAFDFDSDRNQCGWHHDRAAFARPEYKAWFDLWEDEGAVSLGRARDYDWMHIQFARL